MWEKYNRKVISRVLALTDAFDDVPTTHYYMVGVMFYISLWYIHMYPTVRSIPGHR